MPDEIVGVADLGSNSARLVLIRVYPDQTYHVIDEYRMRVRLAEQLDAGQLLSEVGIGRALETARAFARLCEAHHATRVLAVATGAMRFARNGSEIAARLEAETGLRFEIISGEREAFLGYLAVIHTLGIRDAMVLDVGGGSAQITHVVERRAVEMASLPLGALTLTRGFLDRNVISAEQLECLEAHLAASFASVPWLTPSSEQAILDLDGLEDVEPVADEPPFDLDLAPSDRSLIGPEELTLPLELPPLDTSGSFESRAFATAASAGVKSGCATSIDAAIPPVLVGLGGTVRNLARVYQRQVSYPLDLLHGLVAPVPALGEIYRMLSRMTLAERKDVSGLTTARADNIVAGAAAICSLADTIGARELVVSGRGIREGLFLESVREGGPASPFSGGPAIYAAANLMRRFDVNHEHARHVASLALSVFDQLTPVHGLGPDERRLLHLAALLHDVGIAVSYYKHAAHGFQILTRAGIEGLTHRELVVVALVVAAHDGQASPHKQWPAFRSLLEAQDLGVIGKLGALLYLCECLDRSEAGGVKGIICHLAADGSSVAMELSAGTAAGFELQEARGALPAIQRACGVRFTLPAA